MPNQPASFQPDGTCNRCSQQHPRCRAHNKHGAPCGRPPAQGTTVCGRHGANAPHVLAASKRRVDDQNAEKIMRMLGEPIDTSPAEALLDTVKRTAGYVAFLRERVAEVDAEDLVWGVTKQKDGHVVVGTTRDATLEATTDSTREAKPNVWLTLLGEWQDRLVKTCTAALSAGIEERRVRLAEQQGELVAATIRAILDDLGLTAEQSAKVAEIVPRHLRLIA